MGVPKKRKTNASTNQRRSHHGLDETKLAKCSNCKEPVMPHVLCSNCGHYKGKKVK